MLNRLVKILCFVKRKISFVRTPNKVRLYSIDDPLAIGCVVTIRLKPWQLQMAKNGDTPV